MSAELEARCTAAAAAVADFLTEVAGADVTGRQVDWQYWSTRLAAELRSLLGQLDAEQRRGRILCAHADQGGKGMHWLEPGEVCPLTAKGRVAHLNPPVGSHVRADGIAEIAAEDVGLVLGALNDGAAYRAGYDDDYNALIVVGYRSLSRALGDDR